MLNLAGDGAQFARSRCSISGGILSLVVGYAIKHLLPKVSNRIIPTVVVIVGIVVALWINQWAVFTPDIILSGALSGLASTGLHQLFKQWIDSGGKVEKQ